MLRFGISDDNVHPTQPPVRMHKFIRRRNMRNRLPQLGHQGIATLSRNRIHKCFSGAVLGHFDMHPGGMHDEIIEGWALLLARFHAAL
jgi:hypothetical protein